MAGDCSIPITGVRMESNSALTGGCISLGENASPMIRDSNFTQCHTLVEGGAISLDQYASPKVANCIIVNSSSFSVGSGIYAFSYSQIELEDVLIQDNFSPNEAAGVYLDDFSQGNFTRVKFLGNMASSSGSGLVVNINAYVMQSRKLLLATNFLRVLGRLICKTAFSKITGLARKVDAWHVSIMDN